MTTATPAFIVSGTSSGSGKTTVALGLMAAFRKQGLNVQPFKCGPDFIDPGLHRLVTDRVSRNLDLWMAGDSFTRATFSRNRRGADLAVIEGVMGMFDGGISSSGSLAAALAVPTILVLDVRSMAESAAAIVKGFETLRPLAAVRGVILNRVASDRHLQLVTEAIRSHCRAVILGHLPRSLDFAIPSRHLGLYTGDEAPIGPEAIGLLADTVTKHVDLAKILELARETPATDCPDLPAAAEPFCRIGVARDRAFCFYYQDNFDLLRAAGAELVFFSPLADERLPEGLDGIYLGGGYPELHARQLSDNKTMRAALREWIEGDGPVYAECGGFMYLTEGIVDSGGDFHEMVGVFPVRAKMQERRASLGYREVRTETESCFGPPGTILRGHEFHYSTIEEMPANISRVYAVNNGAREGYRYRQALGGYMHLHFGSAPHAAREFVIFCNNFKR